MSTPTPVPNPDETTILPAEGARPAEENPYAQAPWAQNPYHQEVPGQGAYEQNPLRQPYGASYAQPVTALAERLRSNSTICLILGVLGLIMTGLFTSIPAWIWGNSIIREAAANGVPEDYVSNAKLGKILGIIGTAIWAVLALLIVLMFIALILFGIVSMNM